jgi:hypothetical protein
VTHYRTKPEARYAKGIMMDNDTIKESLGKKCKLTLSCAVRSMKYYVSTLLNHNLAHPQIAISGDKAPNLQVRYDLSL